MSRRALSVRPGHSWSTGSGKYTFVAEQRFSDKADSAAVAKVLFDELLRNATMTALTFCAVHPDLVDVFFEESLRCDTRMAAGKVLMDRNAPDAPLETAKLPTTIRNTLIARWHRCWRNLCAVIQRFAPTSTQAELDVAATLRRETLGALMLTRVSKNLGEIARVRSLFPDSRDIWMCMTRRGSSVLVRYLPRGASDFARTQACGRGAVGGIALPDVEPISG